MMTHALPQWSTFQAPVHLRTMSPLKAQTGTPHIYFEKFHGKCAFKCYNYVRYLKDIIEWRAPNMKNKNLLSNIGFEYFTLEYGASLEGALGSSVQFL